MVIYDYSDYKRFLNKWIEHLPNKGRGQARRLAEHLEVHPVVISQILSGDRDFTPEQALDVSVFLGLDDRASDYLGLMVAKSRAGTKRLQLHISKKLELLKQEALEIKNRIPEIQKLSEEDTAVFYSNWMYAAVSLLVSIPGYQSVEKISEYFAISRKKTLSVLEYLTTRGLCKIDEKGNYVPWTTSTFIDSSSPFINNLHRNWRLKALERMTNRKDNDFFYSAPGAITEKEKDAFREDLVKLVLEYLRRAEASPNEKLVGLNIDFFDF